MRLSFNLSSAQLYRTRRLRIVAPPANMTLPASRSYEPLRSFIAPGSYPFTLQHLLHVVGVKMFAKSLGWSARTPKRLTLFAVGGLYLALDPAHEDLCLRQHFGDFSSGFSHQFGVGFASMLASQAYCIPWDKLGPIPVSRTKTLDFCARLPRGGSLYVEAKGTTSQHGRTQLLRSGFQKKLKASTSHSTATGPLRRRTVLVVIVAQATKQTRQHGSIVIGDPPLDIPEQAYSKENQLAGRYIHYAAVAAFAGLDVIARHLINRGRGVVYEQKALSSTGKLIVADDARFNMMHTNLIGCQWQFDELNGGSPGETTWFYHGIAEHVVRPVVEKNELPIVGSFPSILENQADPQSLMVDRFSETGEYISSLLPDGSFLGIGSHPIPGLRILKNRDEDFGEPLAVIE